jgi:hypothetical protein
MSRTREKYAFDCYYKSCQLQCYLVNLNYFVVYPLWLKIYLCTKNQTGIKSFFHKTSINVLHYILAHNKKY